MGSTVLSNLNAVRSACSGLPEFKVAGKGAIGII